MRCEVSRYLPSISSAEEISILCARTRSPQNTPGDKLITTEVRYYSDRTRVLVSLLFQFPNLAVSFLYLQMPISAGHWKQNTNAMKAYRKQRQYIYHHCQLSHVTPSHTLIVGVCLLMLPMLELTTEYVQLKIMYYRNPINQWRVRPRHMTFSHTHLPPFLSNVLPAMILQNRVVWSNIICLSYTSSHCSVYRLSLSLAPTCLERRVVLLLLLLISGDIETNPGPVGECSFLMYLKYNAVTYVVNCKQYHCQKFE